MGRNLETGELREYAEARLDLFDAISRESRDEIGDAHRRAAAWLDERGLGDFADGDRVVFEAFVNGAQT